MKRGDIFSYSWWVCFAVWQNSLKAAAFQRICSDHKSCLKLFYEQQKLAFVCPSSLNLDVQLKMFSDETKQKRKTKSLEKFANVRFPIDIKL